MKSRRRSRKQFGGSPSVGFDGSTLMSASGVPIDIHSASDPHCMKTGGRRRRSHSRLSRRRSHSKQWQQRGGGCGCNFQMGGNRSFGFELDPSLGKVYSGLSINPCPSAASGGRRRRRRSQRQSRRNHSKQWHQRGGSAAQELLVSAEPAGYSMGRPFTSSSASFLEPIAYNPTSSCSGGGRRTRRK
jgi:hypothetical protein